MNRTTACIHPTQRDLTLMKMSCALVVAALARPRGALALFPARALGAIALRCGGGNALLLARHLHFQLGRLAAPACRCQSVNNPVVNEAMPETQPDQEPYSHRRGKGRRRAKGEELS